MEAANLYSDSLLAIYGKHWSDRWDINEWMLSLNYIVKDLKKRTVCLFKENCETGLTSI